MGPAAAAERRKQKRAAVRIGRPPRELAGQVEERILAAARSMFLERGLAGASIDEIARLARAGKPTIYARYPTKEALFTAVVMRNGDDVRARFEATAPTGATIEERLANMGMNILERLLDSDAINFMRLSAFEASRFPDLARAGRMARESGMQATARLLAQVVQSDEIGTCPAFAPQSIETTTRFYLDLVVARLFTRALLGEDLKQLRAEIEPHVSRSVAFFLAACRSSRDS
jgi:AcrR family transcriptional regulator